MLWCVVIQIGVEGDMLHAGRVGWMAVGSGCSHDCVILGDRWSGVPAEGP